MELVKTRLAGVQMNQHLGALLSRAGPANVRDGGDWGEMHLPAGSPQSVAQVDLFGVHEECFVESADRLEGLAANRQGCPGHPRDFACSRVSPRPQHPVCHTRYV